MHSNVDRREFISRLGLASIPALLPVQFLYGNETAGTHPSGVDQDDFMVNFAMDGLFYSPTGYIKKLQKINAANEISEDMYFEGGITGELEKRFSELTGKARAIYLPTGTMANQVAIKLLSGANAKILVPENSHIFRDEADAAQRVHQKRLIPYGTQGGVAGLEELRKAEAHTLEHEVFQSGLNTVVVENPVRRENGRVLPFNDLKALTSYCREKGYRLHLDGARLHLASAYTGVSVQEYASLFDTVYISLYKYLHAGGGAILCGDEELITKVKAEIKVLGGTMWQSWYNTAMAASYLEAIDSRWQKIRGKGDQLVQGLNKIPGLQVKPVANGTNIYQMETGSKQQGEQLVTHLVVDHQIYLRAPDENGRIWFYINESTLHIPNTDLLAAFSSAWTAK